MHSIAAQLSNHIKRAVSGPMWHGAALDELLAHVSCEQAAARPIPGAHSIWKIVLHVAAWPAADWQAALERLRESYRALATDTRRLDQSAIDAKVPGLDYSVSNLLHGVIEHATYHGGQIALLKRALEGRQP